VGHPGVPEVWRLWRPGWPVPLHAVLGSLGRGAGDPAHRRTADGALWRVSLTPDGPATLRLLTRPAEGAVAATAWGRGSGWVLDRLPDLLGARDDPAGFVPRHAVVAEAWRRWQGWRVPRTGLVMESLVPAVLEQKVTGSEARQAWRWLLQRYGESAPGPAPAGMRVPLPPQVWRQVPSWDWHRAGVDGRRSRTVVAAARVADRLEETADLPAEDAERRLRSVPGVGQWTAAEVLQRAHGCPDAVSVGDLHLAAFVGWTLTGAPVDDAGMLALLRPYAGHRYRAVRMLELSGRRKPRFGPRQAPRAFTHI
jgi:3-methyladenine DNA glycosylase/8-oxoguanine DNA glycosylase